MARLRAATLVPSVPPLAAFVLAIGVALLPVVEHLIGGVTDARVGAACATGLLAAGVVGALLAAPGRGWVAVGGAPAAWLTAWCGAAAVSAAAGGQWTAAVPALTWLGVACALLLLCAGWPRDGTHVIRAWFGTGLIAGGVLAAIVALQERATGPGVTPAELALLRSLDPAMADQVVARIGQGRAAAYFLYPNALAGYLLLALPVAAERWAVGGRGWLTGAAVLFMLAGLAVSGSIGGAGCLAAGLLLTALRPAPKGPRPAAAWGMAVIAAGLLVAVLWSRPAAAWRDGATTKMRHWREVVGRVDEPRKFLLGLGPGRYAAAAGGALSPGVRARAAHHWLLETFVEQGALGVACWVGLMCSLLRLWWRSPGGWGFAAAWLAGLLHACVDLDYLLPALAFPWWTLAGWLAADDRGTDGGKAPARRWTPGVTRGRISAAVLLASLWLTGATRGATAVLWLGLALGSAAAACLIARWTQSRAGSWNARRDAPWGLLVLVAAAWAALGDAPDAGSRAALEAAGLLGVGWAARVAVAEGGGAWLASGIRGSALFLAVLALAEFARTGHPAAVVFPSPNFLATFLLAGFGMWLGTPASGRAGRSGGAGSGLLRLAGAAVLLAGLAATGSSGAAFAAALLVAGWWLARWPGRLRIAGVVIFALGFGVWAVPGVDALSLVQRGVMWREGAQLLAQAPFGIGPGTYARGVLRVQAASVTSAGVGRFSLVAEFAHCEPLQFAVEWGVPAFGLLLWGVWIVARGAARRDAIPWRWGAAAIALHALTDFPLRAPALELLAAIALGAATAGPAHSGARRAAPPPVGVAAGRRLAVAAALLAALAWVRPPLARWLDDAPPSVVARELPLADEILTLWPVSCAGHLRAADARVAVCASTGVYRGAAAIEAADEFAAAVWAGDGSGGARMAQGKFLLDRAVHLRRPEDLNQARAAFAAEAAAAPRRPQPWIGMARVALAAGSWTGADRALAAALDREPFALEAMALRGVVAERRGEPRAAREFYRRTLLLRAAGLQRPGLNAYERGLLDVDVSRIRGRLLDLGDS